MANRKKNNVKINKTIKKNKFNKILDEILPLIIIIFFVTITILLILNNIELNKIKINLKNNQIEKNIIKKDERIIFLGDSITYGYDIKKYYDNENYINKGISGDKTENILNRLKESVYDYDPDKVILLIGTNDINRKIDPVNNIELIINKIKNHNPNTEIIVESIYPINNSSNNKINHNVVGRRSNKEIKEINKKIEKVCVNNGITYINLYDELIDKEGNLKIEYTKEGLHINDEGYKKITTIINKYINKRETAIK